MIALRQSLVVVVVLAGGPQGVAAQNTGPALRPKHLTVSGGLLVSAGYPVGDRNAELRRNSTAAPSSFTLFRAESTLERVRALEARIGVALSRALAIEVGGTYGQPQLGVTISQDSETDAGTALVVEDISQYTVDVSGVFQLSRLKMGPRARPYVAAGGGYLRQRHQDRLLVETGRTFHFGGGVRYWLRGGSARARALGVRADARFVHRFGGIDFENKRRGYPVFSLLGFAGF